MTRLTTLQHDLEKKRVEFENSAKEAKDIQTYLAKTMQERDEARVMLEQLKTRNEELEEMARLSSRSSSQGFSTKKQ
jgi:hypothetical protein